MFILIYNKNNMNSDEEHETYLMEDEDNLIHTINQVEQGQLIVCNNCGNIWDGNAQCNCWGWNYILEQFNDDIDEDIPTILSIDNDGITDTESIDSDEEN